MKLLRPGQQDIWVPWLWGLHKGPYACWFQQNTGPTAATSWPQWHSFELSWSDYSFEYSVVRLPLKRMLVLGCFCPQPRTVKKHIHCKLPGPRKLLKWDYCGHGESFRLENSQLGVDVKDVILVSPVRSANKWLFIKEPNHSFTTVSRFLEEISGERDQCHGESFAVRRQCQQLGAICPGLGPSICCFGGAWEGRLTHVWSLPPGSLQRFNWI